jgi:hypothetical protein
MKPSPFHPHYNTRNINMRKIKEIIQSIKTT